MALVGVSQYNHHHQQIDEYEYDDTDNFYDDGANFGNYLDVDDSEGKPCKSSNKTPNSITQQVFHSAKFARKTIKNLFFHSSAQFTDTEEASESEYGHTGRPQNEPLEIKEL